MKRIISVSGLISVASILFLPLQPLLMPLITYYLLWIELPTIARYGAIRLRESNMMMMSALYIMTLMLSIVFLMSVFVTCGFGGNIGFCNYDTASFIVYSFMTTVPVIYFYTSIIVMPRKKFPLGPILIAVFLIPIIYFVVNMVPHVAFGLLAGLWLGSQVSWLLRFGILWFVVAGAVVGVLTWWVLLISLSRCGLVRQNMQ